MTPTADRVVHDDIEASGNGIDAPAFLRRLVLEQVVPASKGPCLAGTFGMATDRSSGSHATPSPRQDKVGLIDALRRSTKMAADRAQNGPLAACYRSSQEWVMEPASVRRCCACLRSPPQRSATLVVAGRSRRSSRAGASAPW